MSDLRAELMAVRENHGGRLTPDAIVTDAADPDHPLHDRFEWNDEVAGHHYRIGQARALIRVVRGPYTSPAGRPETVRFFHAIPDAQGMAYQPLDEVTGNDIASAVLLRSMEREWRSLLKRYEKFTEFRTLVLGDLGTDEVAS